MTRDTDKTSDPNAEKLAAIQKRLAEAVRQLRDAAHSGEATDSRVALDIANRLDVIVGDLPAVTETKKAG